MIVTCLRGRPSFLPKDLIVGPLSYTGVYVGPHVQYRDNPRVRFEGHINPPPCLPPLLNNTNNIHLLFPFAATFNPLLRFVYHLPVKANNNTQHTHVFQTTINTTGRPGRGAYCAFPSPFIDARVALRITQHLHVSIQCETND